MSARQCQICKEVKDIKRYFTMALFYCDTCCLTSDAKALSNVLPIQRKCVNCSDIKEKALHFTMSPLYCDACCKVTVSNSNEMAYMFTKKVAPEACPLQSIAATPSAGRTALSFPLSPSTPNASESLADVSNTLDPVGQVAATSQCHDQDQHAAANGFQDDLTNETCIDDIVSEMSLDIPDLSFLDGEALPEGVQLHSLECGSDLHNAPEAYATALKELGGEEYLIIYREKMEFLHATVRRNVQDFQIQDVCQHPAWTSFELTDFLCRIASKEMRKPGVEALQKLQTITGAEVAIAKPKGKERSQTKVDIKYGGDVTKLVDVNRATVVCQTTEELWITLTSAMLEWCTALNHVVELEDHYFSNPMQHGYRHVQLVVNFGGVLWEVQFNTRPFIKAKKDGGHRAYKTLRYLKEMALYFSMKNDHSKLQRLLDHPGVQGVMDVNFVKDKWGRSALHYAAFYGNMALVRLLLQWKADVWATDHAGQLPIQHAAVRHCWVAATAISQAMHLTSSPSNQDLGLSLLVTAEYGLRDGYQKLSCEMLRYAAAMIDARCLFRSPYASTICVEAVLSLMTDLDLQENDIGEEVANMLAQVLETNDTLVSLNLRGNHIGADGVQRLAKALQTNATLGALNLAGNYIGDAGVALLADALRINATLSSLNLNYNRISHNGAEHLAQVLQTNTTLRSLNLAGNRLNEDGAELLAQALQTNFTLSSLNLAGNQIHEHGAKSFAQVLPHNSTLSSLNLEDNRVGDAGVEHLAKGLLTYAALTALNLRFNQIGPHGAKLLSQALRGNVTLQSLNLADNSIEDAGFEHLAQALQSHPTLRSLNLAENTIVDAGIKHLAQALRTNTALHSLNLAGTQIDDSDVEGLAQALQTNKTLRYLNLAGNRIHQGAQLLAEALQTNTTPLIHLDLTRNFLFDQGLQALAEALQANTTLTSLNLAVNEIEGDGLDLLAHALQINTTLSSLDLSVNQIDGDGAGLLAEALQNNTTLTSLNLADNLVPEEIVQVLAQAVQNNTTLTSLNLAGHDTGCLPLGGTALVEDDNFEVAALQPHHTTEIHDPMQRHKRVPNPSILPDGVKLDSLATPALGQCALGAYSQALSALGGEDELASCGPLLELPATSATRQHHSRQHHGYSSFPLPLFLQDISSDVMRQCGLEEIQRVVDENGCEVEIGKIKELQRAQTKVDIKYGGDLLKLVDVNRATVVCETSEGLKIIVTKALQRWTTMLSYVVELEDHYFSTPMQHGYRHVQLVVNFSGVLWEVQFNTRPFINAKKKGGHQVYKTLRYINEMVLYHSIYNDADEMAKLFAIVGPGYEGFDVNLVRDKWGRSALHYAAFHGNDTLVDMLLKYDADVFMLDKMRQLPIQQAVLQQRWPVAHTLGWHMAKCHDHLSEDSLQQMYPSLMMAAEYLLHNNCDVPFSSILEGKKFVTGRCLLKYTEFFDVAGRHLDSLELAESNIDSVECELLARVLRSNAVPNSLNLAGNCIGDDLFKVLAQALQANTTVSTLNLAGNDIGDEGTDSIAQVLETNTTLTSLTLENNNIGAEGAESIAQAVQTNPTLRSLNLGNNKIGDGGAKSIARALENNPPLSSLSLVGNDIGATGTESIAQVLETNTTLTSLNLEGNDISDGGLASLSRALSLNASLLSLSLHKNNISSAKVSFLAEALKTNTTLTFLSLSRNSIGTSGTRLIAEALQTNTTLSTLSLNCNDIRNEGVEVLAQALQANTTLTCLEVYDNRLDKQGLITVVHAAEANTKLAWVA